jgi:hypothetical protein
MLMSWTESFTEWVVDGKPLQVGLSRYGSGPEMLLLPALSSISTRDELRELQIRLGEHYSTGRASARYPVRRWRGDQSITGVFSGI